MNTSGQVILRQCFIEFLFILNQELYYIMYFSDFTFSTIY